MPRTPQPRPARLPMSEVERAGLPSGAGLWRERVNWLVHFAPGLDLVYVQNNKAACTTIKRSLLESLIPPEEITESSLNTRREGPFATHLLDCDRATIADILARPIFTVVRNPYVRILSAYLDKLKPGSRVRMWFCRRFSIKDLARISFLDFLTCIASQHPRRIDAHFAPQYVVTLAHHVDYDFVGSVEQMDDVAAYLRRNHLSFITNREHATKAASFLEEHYCERTEALVREIYAEDFCMFGYTPGLDHALEPPELANRAPPRGVPLAAFAASPDEVEQPGTREIEAWRAFNACPEGKGKIEIARQALTFTDCAIVQHFISEMATRTKFDLAYDLLKHRLLLVTRHMDMLPESLLSPRGRRLKREREKVLRS
jgi:hypothetical protein